ncbi:hypothetical protein AB0H03_20735 [Streptomyces sparsogenes]|uniref:hypothetical protein n=1 Tax=Streptomyces sparsogenes TaxID=67365 RepID=UPI0034033F04
MIDVTVPTSPPRPPHTFLKAGHDHYRAAKRLTETGPGTLTGPADHLAGLAAECVIKAMLIDFFGSVQDHPHAIPYSPTLKSKLQAEGELTRKQLEKESSHGHLPHVWDQLALLASGRRGAKIQERVPRQNPFSEPSDRWDVAHRYRDGSLISKERVARHLAAALSLITAYELAK